ncbi:MAG TPA: redoxin domain-containing protein [Pseudoneobacillus sp.]|nr:redoxin domain-containing protein [Pseudoneobacillus sp.]
MVKKVIAAVVLIVLFIVAIVQAMDHKSTEDTIEPASAGIKIGTKAPDFELKTLNGESVKLSELKGKKVILNFWATWCPPCKAEMPEMQKYYEEIPDDITILAVNIDPQLDVQKFVDEMGITFTIPLDDDDLVSTEYQIISIPTTFFIDTKGIIREKHVGAMSYDMMKDFTEKLK